MAKKMKKKNKIYRFRVPYSAEATCKGTAIVEMGEDELEFKRGKVDMEMVHHDMIDQVANWAEGTQNICEPAYQHGGVKADFTTQCDDWCYWPEKVEVGEIEDITDSEALVDCADISPSAMEVWLPLAKGVVKNMQFYNADCPADVPRPIKVTIRAEPDQPLHMTIHCRRRADVENVLRWFMEGDFTCGTKKEAAEVHKLLKQCIEN
tara:strand:- start:1494 stop:2114 length:621 start_codon:yes stop_codon:yes gene_type:complete